VGLVAALEMEPPSVSQAPTRLPRMWGWCGRAGRTAIVVKRECGSQFGLCTVASTFERCGGSTLKVKDDAEEKGEEGLHVISCWI